VTGRETDGQTLPQQRPPFTTLLGQTQLTYRSSVLCTLTDNIIYNAQ